MWKPLTHAAAAAAKSPQSYLTLTCFRSVNGAAAFKSGWQFLRMLETELLRDPAIPPLGTHSG